MKSAILITTKRAVIGCLCAATLGVVACGEGRGGPTIPSASAAVSSLVAPGSEGAVQQSVDNAQSGAASSPNAHLVLTKTCDAYNHCTVGTSEEGPIPVGTEAFYTGPVFEKRTSSGVVLTTPTGDTATGHCTLNYETGLGTCVFTSGTGELAGFHANLKVTSDFVSNPAGVFTWEGTYRFVGD